MKNTLFRNRNMYVWFTPGDPDGVLAYATYTAVKRFRREGEMFRQATMQDWEKACNLKPLKK